MIISRYGQRQRQYEFVKDLFGYEAIIKVFVAGEPSAQMYAQQKFIVLLVNTRGCNHHFVPAFRGKLKRRYRRTFT